jgi:hypothetical protein
MCKTLIEITRLARCPVLANIQRVQLIISVIITARVANIFSRVESDEAVVGRNETSARRWSKKVTSGHSYDSKEIVPKLQH